MENSLFDSIDESCRQKFESAWLEDQHPEIEDFLPDPTSSRYVGTLEELAHIDMEFRWKRASQTGSDEGGGVIDAPRSVEWYLEKYSGLSETPILSRLVQAEYELRCRHNENPGWQEYGQRFPALAASGVQFQELLEPIARTVQAVTGPVEPGEQIGRYKLVAEHGKGGFGAVWRADDTKLHRRIALKRLNSHLSRQSELRRRFESEARITAQLEHPGIVPIYDVSALDERHAYYTMKLVHGQTMEDVIDRVHQLQANSTERAVESRRLLQSILDVCHTIQYCHVRGVIHRDLKPQNVILGDYGETIVLDWGLAATTDEVINAEFDDRLQQDERILTADEALESLRRSSSVQGTPAYMPPELASGHVEEVGTLSDIFSLGAMLYHAITGQAPCTDGQLDEFWDRVRTGKFTPPRQLEPTIPKPLETICCKAMHPQSADRYQDVRLLIADLQHYLADEPVTTWREPWTIRTARWIRKHAALTTGIVTSLMFLLVASVISILVWQNLREQEQNRVNDIRVLAERSEASAMTQLVAGQYQGAQNLLEQAVNLTEPEPALVDRQRELAQRLDQVSRIVDFYRWGERAQEYLFFDQFRETTIYSQSALQRIGALDQRDWWNHLPVDSLPAIEIQKLKDEVYRQLGMLATIRFAEKAEEGFSVQWLASLAGDEELAPDPLLDAAMFAARQANAYRPARILQIIIDLSEVSRGDSDTLNLLINEPLNPTDAAMLGSILDTHAPQDALGQMMLQPFLGMKNPRSTARQWLLDALTHAPDWYWLPIFMGSNELKSGETQQSIRSFSHAVGVQPDGWVAYMYRAVAFVNSAEESNSQSQKKSDLRRAAIDLQRARDLEENNSALFWSDGYLQSRTEKDPRIAVTTFLEALKRHPRIGQIQGANYFGSITGTFLDVARQHARLAVENNPGDVESVLLTGAIELWSGNVDEAKKIIEDVLILQPDHGLAEGLLGICLVLGENSADESGRAMNLMTRSIASNNTCWHVILELARLQEQGGDPGSALQTLDKAGGLARTRWQKSVTWLWRARLNLRLQNDAAALADFRTAIAENLAIDLTPILAAANEHPVSRVTQAIRAHELFVKPRINPGDGLPAIISRPALLNSDFELGLSFAWTDSDTGNTSGEVESQASVLVTRDESHQGQRSLYIQNPELADADPINLITQNIPVSPGVTYQVSFWVKSRQLNPGGLVLEILDGSNSVPIAPPPGEFEWQEVTGQFVPEGDNVIVQVKSGNICQVWIDEIQIDTGR